MTSTSHQHGPWSHAHPHHGPHRHCFLPVRSRPAVEPLPHVHGRVDRSIVRSRAGVRAVGVSLTVLVITAGLQALVFILSGSVALLADLVHNSGDALTAVPLGVAFLVRSERGERWAGYAVVLVVLASASLAAYTAVERLIHPQQLNYLLPLACAGLIGFAGNEIVAKIRLDAGVRLDSPALTADGQHARVDGFVSLSVVASAGAVALGFSAADPLIGLAITVLILRITYQAYQTVRADHAGHDHSV